jgi:hypothetical protein
LAVITAGVVLLAVVAVVVTLAAGSGDPEPLPEGSPEAAVQRFIIAIDDGEYSVAYRLLDEDARKQCFENDFRNRVSNGRNTDMRVQLESVDLFDDEAGVTVKVRTFSGSPPFDFSESNYTAFFQLRNLDSGWTILNAPQPFSGCGLNLRQPVPSSSPTPTPGPTPAESAGT